MLNRGRNRVILLLNNLTLVLEQPGLILLVITFTMRGFTIRICDPWKIFWHIIMPFFNNIYLPKVGLSSNLQLD